MFIEEEDLLIAENVFNLFEAVRDRWKRAWDTTGRGYMLNKTNGFRALMRFLRPAYLHFTSPGGVVKVGDFAKLFKKVKLDDDDFVIDRFKPGSSGETDLYRALVRETGVSVS